MGDITSSIRISAPPQAVFDFVDRWENSKLYLRRIVRWEPVDADATTGVGATFYVGIQAGPTRLDGRLEVIRHEPPSVIGFRSQEGPRVEGAWTFNGDTDATTAELSASYDLPGGIAGRVVNAFLARNARNDLDSSLRELKRLVEAQ